MYEIKAKPLSANKLYTGRRYKTDDYRAYINELNFLLPHNDEVKFNRNEDVEIMITVGLCNRMQDLDNTAKGLIDIMQAKYNFNDYHIVKLIMEKNIVKSGDEYIKFSISNITKNYE